MKLFLLLLGPLLLCTPTWLTFVARRVRVREVSTVALAGVALGAASAELGLVLTGVSALGAAGHHGAVLERCGPLLLPGPLVFRLVSAVLAVLLPAAGLAAWRRTRVELDRLRVEPEVGRHTTVDGVDVVSIASPVVAAYSLGGRHPQVVISDGLAALLEPSELRAVIDHELAHIRHRHGTVLRLLAALETAVPPIRRTTTRLRVMLERRADEDAIGFDCARRLSLLDALLKVAGVDAQPALAAFAHESGIVERAEALLDEPRADTRIHRLADRVALSGATACGFAAVGGAVMALRLVMAAAGICCP